MGEKVDYCVGGIRAVESGDSKQKAPLQGDLLTGADYASASVPESRAGAFSNLRILVLDHDRGDTSVRLMKYNSGNNQWEDTGLGVSFDDEDSFPQLFEDTETEPIEFSAGDKFCWEIEMETSGSTVVSYISVQVEFD